MAKPTRESKKRIPAGMPRQKLKVDGIAANMRGYWAKEEQFEELRDAGYNFVPNSDDITIGEDGYVNKSSIISRPASRTTEEKLYLMQIPKEYYEENQKIKQARIDATEQSIKDRPDTEHSYKVKESKFTTETLGA